MTMLLSCPGSPAPAMLCGAHRLRSLDPDVRWQGSTPKTVGVPLPGIWQRQKQRHRQRQLPTDAALPRPAATIQPPRPVTTPTKPTTIVDLAKLESPVRFVYSHNVFSTVLDEAGKTLWCDLMALSRDEKVLPQAIRQDLESLIGSKAISESMWDTSPQQANEAAAKAELDKILQLTLDTKLAEQRRKSEAGWNEDVHKPVLRLALAFCPVVQAETVSSAKLVPAFRPPLADAGGHELSAPDVQSSATGTDMGSGTGGGVTYHRIVDYVLTLDAERAQSNSDVAIYQSLTRQITAFQEKPVPPDSDNKPPQIPALPAITVFNGSWELALAVDLDVEVAGQNQPRKETHIVGPNIPIGNTYIVRGTYRLLASLRRLATWMEQDYRPWLEATLSWAGYE
ncbi:hypothetical protein B0T18DRAFT_484288 [Schizothecium vesticola]|uniref:PD-(D/E)XK nuclease-like domain-containing protein n=1 Tax=Schizothecium vesticola TaxID=314040 RepID=A0AA40KC80_9PEZI|nr:hypothetical protein B0T18DRAFT_484288 [Schizothecium vesticola]